MPWGFVKKHGTALRSPDSSKWNNDAPSKKSSPQKLASHLLGLNRRPNAWDDIHRPKIGGILAHVVSGANREEFGFRNTVNSIRLGLDDLICAVKTGKDPGQHHVKGRVLSKEQLKFQKRFHGWWHADFEMGDSNKHLADAMELGWLMRKALNHLDRIHFDVQRDSLGTKARVWNLINVNDRRPWSGEKIKVKRKDRRKGQATTWVEPTKTGFAVT
ncbi:hypothetical protein BSKO_05165 [Bryopsis sp. KO-2023]|nr:hypothetical protein BSKO_05165 [Bryopsis sp. KO-2023]